MKGIAIFALILALIAVGAGGYALFTTQAKAEPVTVSVMPASEQTAEFNRVRQALENNALRGTAFKKTLDGGADDYTFLVYTFKVTNACLLPFEMVEIQASALSNDALSYSAPDLDGNETNIVINPGESKEIWCVLLTEKGSHTVRDFYITYYIWGHPQRVKVTYG